MTTITDKKHPAEKPPTFFCSDLSRQAGEALIGSAPRAKAYFLLEYSGAWESKAFEQSALPAAVKSHLSAALGQATGVKLVLIKGQPGVKRAGIRFFAARVSDTQPRLYTARLGVYEDLLNLDLLALLGDDPLADFQRLDELLYLVCTNGRRDACCARYGVGFYTAVSQLVGESAWQCTHLGGHRFAPNFLVLPWGLCYGRLQPGEATRVVDACRAGEIDLQNYRGRMCYAEPVQAAEYYLRLETGQRRLEALRLVRSEQVSPLEWEVVFAEAGKTVSHRLGITIERSEQLFYQSCKQDKAAPLTHYRLRAHQVESG